MYGGHPQSRVIGILLCGGSGTAHTNVGTAYSASYKKILKFYSYNKILCTASGIINVLPFGKRLHICISLSIFACLCVVSVCQQSKFINLPSVKFFGLSQSYLWVPWFSVWGACFWVLKTCQFIFGKWPIRPFLHSIGSLPIVNIVCILLFAYCRPRGSIVVAQFLTLQSANIK